MAHTNPETLPSLLSPQSEFGPSVPLLALPTNDSVQPPGTTGIAGKSVQLFALVSIALCSSCIAFQRLSIVDHPFNDSVRLDAHLIHMGHMPSTMHLVHRDSSANCAPPRFQCISEQIGPTPVLQPGFALIKVSGSAINHDDTSETSMYRQYYDNITMGFDAAGTVIAVDQKCSKLKVGDHVWATFPVYTSACHGSKSEISTPGEEGPDSYCSVRKGSGGLAQYATVACSYSGIAPSSVDLAVAGTLPTNALTSLGALKSAGAPWTSRNFTVLIAAGTGGTGYSAVQLAKAFGATTVVTAAGGEEGVNFVKSLGADVAVDYHSGSVFDAVADGSVDFVLDNLGVDANLAVQKLKSPGGVFISLVNPKPSSEPQSGVRKAFFDVWANDQLPKLADRLNLLANLIDSGKFKVFVDATYDFDHIKDAYHRLLVQGNLKSRIGVVPKRSGSMGH